MANSAANKPLVSIIIPSAGREIEKNGKKHSYLIAAIQSIFELSTFSNFEIICVLDCEASPSVVARLKTYSNKVRILDWFSPFNFSKKINFGVANSNGDYILLLNDDIEVISPDWIEHLLAQASKANIAFVGAKLFFEDGSLQHGGHLYGLGGPGHRGFKDLNPDQFMYSSILEVDGVTAACSMISLSKFIDIGGFSSIFPGNYNDVDACLKARQQGLINVYVPDAQLYHFESITREPSVKQFEVNNLMARWGSFFS